jgi:alpha-L-fucosidase 2
MRYYLAWCLIALLLLTNRAAAQSAPDTNTKTPADVPESVQVVSKIFGVTTGLSTNVVARGFTDGPLMGNGDIGVTQGGDRNSQTFYISKTDMISKALGGITLTNLTQGSAPDSYRYEQDIYHAQVKADVTMCGVPFVFQTWTSANENLVVMELTNQNSDPVDMEMDLWIYNKVLPPPAHKIPAVAQAGTKNDVLWGTRSLDYSAAEPGIKINCALAARVLGADASTSTNDQDISTAKFSIPANQKITVVVVVDGQAGFSAHMPDVGTSREDAIGKVNQISDKSLALARAQHLHWWETFWSKSSVVLNDARLEKFYYGALYALACSNREGKVAPGLWGSWTPLDDMLWDGGYFSNYNFQAPYWGIYTSNHQELGIPFNDQVYGHEPWARNRAHAAGYPGLDSYRVPFVASLDLTGYSNSIPPVRPIASQTNRSKLNDQLQVVLLNITNLVNYYEYTMDQDYLRERLYPYLTELGQFWDSYLVKVDGKYVINESGAREADAGKSTNSISDLGLVRYLYKSLLVTSEDLDVDADKRQGWQEKLDNLSDYPTTVQNGKTVFKECLERKGMTLKGPHDNPVNVLHIFPAEGIGLESDETRKTVAQDTIEQMDSWNQSNGFPFYFPAAVRVGYDPTKILEKLTARLSSSQWRESNLTLYQYPGGGGIEMCGGIEAINSMLLQSYESAIQVFPNWPNDKPAKFKGLRAKGAFLVDAEFDKGAVTSVQIYSEKGKSCHIINPWPDALLVINDGTTTIPAVKNGEEYVFNTIAGHAYTLSK